MWVADMEFATAPAVCQAMKERIDRRIFGYTNVFGTDYYEALKKWCEDLYGWSFPQEELTFSSGSIPALYELAEDLLEKDETILITTPAYGFFQHTAEYNHVGLSCSPLKRVDGMFQIDFEDFERRAADPKTKLILWCNPHNPTGRIWTEEELAKVGEDAEMIVLPGGLPGATNLDAHEGLGKLIMTFAEAGVSIWFSAITNTLAVSMKVSDILKALKYNYCAIQ